MPIDYFSFKNFMSEASPQFIDIADKFENERRDRSPRSERCVTACLTKGSTHEAKHFCWLAARYYKYRSVHVDCSQSGAVVTALKADYRQQVSLVFMNGNKLNLNDAIAIERALSGRDKNFSLAVALMFFLTDAAPKDAVPYNLRVIRERSQVITFAAERTTTVLTFGEAFSPPHPLCLN